MSSRRAVIVRPSPSLAPAGSTSAALTASTTLPAVPDNLAPLFANPAVSPAIDAFEEALGGRDSLVGELLTAPDLTPRMQQILQLVLDPRFDKLSLGELCDQGGLLPGEVFAAFRDAAVARANVLALKTTADRLPTVVASLLDAAVDRTEVCPACDGLKVITDNPSKKDPNPSPHKCTACSGRGSLYRPADREAQKIALELVGLLRKPGGVNIGINQTNQTQQNLVHVEGGGGLAQFQQAVSGLLFGLPITLPASPAPLIDVEIVPTFPEASA